jgi:hypothetical protein
VNKRAIHLQTYLDLNCNKQFLHLATVIAVGQNHLPKQKIVLVIEIGELVVVEAVAV